MGHENQGHAKVRQQKRTVCWKLKYLFCRLVLLVTGKPMHPSDKKWCMQNRCGWIATHKAKHTALFWKGTYRKKELKRGAVLAAQVSHAAQSQNRKVKLPRIYPQSSIRKKLWPWNFRVIQYLNFTRHMPTFKNTYNGIKNHSCWNRMPRY